jgi:thymidylate synthase
MRQYLNLLARILEEGENVRSGAVIQSEERKATCRMLLGQQMRFDLREGFPIVTTKAVPFDIVVDEVLWFLRGETNVNTLGREVRTPLEPIEGEGPAGGYQTRTIRRHIWDAWAQPDGDVPHIYGESWRRWSYPDGFSVRLDGEHASYARDRESRMGTIERWDQVNCVLEQLREVVKDPSHRSRRRIILSAWNPPLVPEMGLAPCHTLSQWLPTNGYLDVVCHWRSIDMFLGCPFNVVQYALLAHMFGPLAGLIPRHLVVNIADCHLYDNQFDQVREQIGREPTRLPYLAISPDFYAACRTMSVEEMKQADPSWFVLDGYAPHQGRLRAEVAV